MGRLLTQIGLIEGLCQLFVNIEGLVECPQQQTNRSDNYQIFLKYSPSSNKPLQQTPLIVTMNTNQYPLSKCHPEREMYVNVFQINIQFR